MAKDNAQVTYLQLISQDEKTQKTEALQIKAQEASIEVQREIMNLNSQIAQKKSAIVAAQRQIPYDVKSEFKLTSELARLEEALEFTQDIKKSRFSDVSI
jgi:hypothetical protein